MNKNLLKKSH